MEDQKANSRGAGLKQLGHSWNVNLKLAMSFLDARGKRNGGVSHHAAGVVDHGKILVGYGDFLAGNAVGSYFDPLPRADGNLPGSLDSIG